MDWIEDQNYKFKYVKLGYSKYYEKKQECFVLAKKNNMNIFK